jgi:hypothetical protein
VEYINIRLNYRASEKPHPPHGKFKSEKNKQCILFIFLILFKINLKMEQKFQNEKVILINIVFL